MAENLYRSIPKTDQVLECSKMQALIEDFSYNRVVEGVREVLEELREGIKNGQTLLVDIDRVCSLVESRVQLSSRPSLRGVVNGTGVILHTNLGRALLAEEAVDAVCSVANSYSTLEYDPVAGSRGSRYTHVEGLVCRIFGCEAAMVVNNNAAAVMLILAALTRGTEVPVSRGELVEIGGSFRVPEIMEQSGVILREVGSTNKTHIRDYENAINENTGALLKVHTSNFKIMGFTDSVSLKDMADIAHKHGLPLIYDLGGGSVCDLKELGIEGEPSITQCASTGADVICFSGDKLLGGPQAGVIIGGRKYIEAMKKHPLTRALRCDKMTIAALCATLELYTDIELAKERIPTLSMLYMSKEEINDKAVKLAEKLSRETSCTIEVVEEEAQVGGGSVPSQMLYTKCVAVSSGKMKTSQLEEALRQQDRPIVARVSRDRILFCMRTTKAIEFNYIADTIKNILGE